MKGNGAMDRPTISCAVIAKNEAHNIPIWYESIQGMFDEYILIDTGSLDGTREVAESLGIQVYDFTWIDDFAAARNFAFSKATKDYIFWNDLDDVFTGHDHFKLWRDNVMSSADYWLAPYHYASNAQGIPVCTFARERVIKRGLGFEWKYFIHEGILPHASIPISAQYVGTWAVKHRRTVEDSAKDKGRNLGIFERHERSGMKFDPRMQYYYGKELFENGKQADSIAWLKSALADEKLELHDRLLGLQYLSYAYMGCNQINEAMQIAHQGLFLAPQRAEFWVLIGDAYLKQGKMVDAVPYFVAAKSCQYSDSGNRPVVGATAIFSHADCYGVYPSNQLARIYANLGDFKKSMTEAELTFSKTGNQESGNILIEVKKLFDQSSYMHASPKDVDEVVFTCPPGGLYEWDWEIYKTQGVGGSETAVCEMADQIHKLSGMKVTVFNTRKKDTVINGVHYISNLKTTEYFLNNKPKLHVAWRHNIKMTDAKTWIWCHDLVTPGCDHFEQYDKLLALSPFHKNYLMAMCGVPEHKIMVTRNGIDPERFAGLHEIKKVPGKVIYRSSPDRGLKVCIEIMDQVVKRLPYATLDVFYGFDNMRKMGMSAVCDELEAMIKKRPYIIFHGNVEQAELSRRAAKGCVWLYPTRFLETYCISAIESLCERVYPVTSQFGALQDTLKSAVDQHCAEWLTDDVSQRAGQVIEALVEDKCLNIHPDRMMNQWSWKSVAQDWLKCLN